jgi:lipopolysaccharide/colanic/teichoic acid biosynthesis glycosyltransferase
MEQRKLIPHWSWVGPRAHNLHYDEHFITALRQEDAGLARDYDASIRSNPMLRRGLTSPGTLHGKTTSDRSPETIVEIARLDLDYFSEDSSWNGDLGLITETPLFIVKAGFAGYFRHRQQKAAAIPQPTGVTLSALAKEQ